MNDEHLRSVLDEYFSKNIQLRQRDKEKALKVWQPIVNAILRHVKSMDPRFDCSVLKYSGSYYERTKVRQPDEFDILVEIENLKLNETYDGVEDEDHLENDPPTGFTTVMIDQGEERIWMPGGHIGNGNLLSSTAIKSTFAQLINRSISDLRLREVSISSHGPAVTLKIEKDGFHGSIDLVLAIKDASWSDDAEDWKNRQRNGWPSQSLMRKIVQGGCHLVAKKPKVHVSARDKDYLWLYSFSHAEKLLFNEGSSGAPGTCRRKLLRILKCLREDLHLTPLKTFHLKMIVLYEYEEFPSDRYWGDNQMPTRFKSALQRLLKCLKQERCPHYFIPDVNLFEGNTSFNRERYQFLINKVEELLYYPLKEIQCLSPQKM